MSDDIVTDHAVLTSDENYVILFGSRHDGPRQLFVMDIRDEGNYILRDCNITCGNLDPVALLRTGHGARDDLLVIGWIRELFATSDFDNFELPPLHIMQMMVPWYSMEMIHVIEDNGGHYVVALQDVMQSMSRNESRSKGRKRKLSDAVDSPNKKRKLEINIDS